MSNNDKDADDTETILLALDQISQTIEVMTSVVGRLRTHVERQDTTGSGKEQQEQQATVPSDRILH